MWICTKLYATYPDHKWGHYMYGCNIFSRLTQTFYLAAFLVLVFTEIASAKTLHKYQCTPNEFVRFSKDGMKKYVAPTSFWIERGYLFIEFTGSLSKYLAEDRRKHQVMGDHWFSANNIDSQIIYRDGFFSWVVNDKLGVQILTAKCIVITS